MHFNDERSNKSPLCRVKINLKSTGTGCLTVLPTATSKRCQKVPTERLVVRGGGCFLVSNERQTPASIIEMVSSGLYYPPHHFCHRQTDRQSVCVRSFTLEWHQAWTHLWFHSTDLFPHAEYMNIYVCA